MLSVFLCWWGWSQKFLVADRRVQLRRCFTVSLWKRRFTALATSRNFFNKNERWSNVTSGRWEMSLFQRSQTPVTSVPRVLFLFLARSLHWFTAAAAPSQSLHVVPQRRWVRATVLRAWTHALDAPDRRNRLPSASARIEVAAMVPRLKKQLTMIRGCKNRGKFWAKYGNSYENNHGNCYYRHIKLWDSCRFLLGSQKGWYQWR